jgi:hypothetical protein
MSLFGSILQKLGLRKAEAAPPAGPQAPTTPPPGVTQPTSSAPAAPPRPAAVSDGRVSEGICPLGTTFVIEGRAA